MADYKGDVLADLVMVGATREGLLQIRPLWASDHWGVTLKQSWGSFDYSKSLSD